MNNELSFNCEKLVMATIQIPLALSKTGEINYLNDYAQITFGECTSLPEKQSLDINIDFSKLFNLKKDASCETDFVETVGEKRHIQSSTETQTETEMVEPEINPQKTEEFALTVYKEEIKPTKRGINNTFKNKRPKTLYNFTKKVK
jgi:hypothetical protein